LKDVLVTTDDLSGVKSDHLARVLEDIVGGSIKGRADLGFSMHHYTLSFDRRQKAGLQNSHLSGTR
jgi:hypothetical protein